MKLYFLPKKDATKEEKIEGLKIMAMWVVGAIYWMMALKVDTDYFRGTFIVFVFAALWLPIRWQNHVRAEMREPSWADQNELPTLSKHIL